MSTQTRHHPDVGFLQPVRLSPDRESDRDDDSAAGRDEELQKRRRLLAQQDTGSPGALLGARWEPSRPQTQRPSPPVKDRPATAATGLPPAAPRAGVGSVNDVLRLNFPDYFDRIDPASAKLRVDVKDEKDGTQMVYPHIENAFGKRDLCFWSPQVRVSFPMVYPVGNSSKEHKEKPFLGDAPKTTYYVLTVSSTPAWEAQDRTEHNQDRGTVQFCEFLEVLNKNITSQLVDHPQAGQLVRAMGEAKAQELQDVKAGLLEEQGFRDAAHEMRTTAPSADAVRAVCLEKLTRPLVTLRKESKKSVEERLLKQPFGPKTQLAIPNTHQVKIRSRTFKQVFYEDQKRRLREKAASHPAIKEAYDCGFDLVDVPMYDAAKLHIRDKNGAPVPIPLHKRKLAHNDLVSLYLRAVPMDFNEQRKGAGILLQLAGIIFFKHGSSFSPVEAPLTSAPAFAFGDSAASGFDEHAEAVACVEPEEEQ